MPFTISHVAAVLPLRDRWKLIWPALIIGSMAPDFEYFMLGAPRTRVLHTFPGVIVYAIPLSLIVLWITHEVMRGPFFEILPTKLNTRFTPRKIDFTNLQQLFMVVVSAAIGIATHIAWDSFTHEDTVITNWASWEHTQLPVPGVGERETYKILQWSSSVIGLLLIALVFYFWYRSTRPRTEVIQVFGAAQKVATWIALFGVAAAITYFRLERLFVGRTITARYYIVAAVVTGLAALFWELLAFSVFQQIRSQWMMDKSQPAPNSRPGAIAE